jgi:energy-converting hydrogenase Eha subunit B
MKTITKGLIGLQDMSLGQGTFSRTTSTGGSQTLDQIPFGSDGSLLTQEINSVLYVGGGVSQWGASSDLGAQINAAYAALPSTGGSIGYLANANGTARSFSTPILFNTNGKYVRLFGVAPASQNGSPESGAMGGCSIIFTPTTSGTTFSVTSVDNADGTTGLAVYHGTFTGGGSNAFAGKTFQIYGFSTNMANNGWYVCTASTATTLTLANSFAVSETHSATASITIAAITFANTDNVNGDAFVAGNVIENLTIANAAQFVTGGNYGTSSGSAAVGIDFSKAGRLATYNVRISGFGIGRQCITAINWGAKDYNLTISHCGVSSIFHDCQEDYAWFGGQCIVNGRGEQYSGALGLANENKYFAVSFDSNGSVYGDSNGTMSPTTTRGYGFAYCSMKGSASPATPSFTDCHFENLISGDQSGAAPPTYIYVGNGLYQIHGGIASNDNNSSQPSGYTAPYWFYNAGTYGGAVATVSGLTLVAVNQPSTCIFSANGGGGFFQGSIDSAARSSAANLIAGSSSNIVNGFTPGQVTAVAVNATAVVDAPVVSSPVYQSQSFVKLLTTAVPLGPNPFGRGLVLLTNEDVGGTAFVLVDTAAASPITIISQITPTGGCVFQTTSPTGNQCQLTIASGPQLAVTGTSTNGAPPGSGQRISYTFLMNIT